MPEHPEAQGSGLGYPQPSRESYVDGELPQKTTKKPRKKVHPGNKFLELEI